MNSSFWAERKVLVTGHTGFKGSWLSLWLQRLRANVIGYSLPPPTLPSLYDMARVSEGMASVLGDVRDLQHLQATLADHCPEIVFHMAAQPLVRRSYQDPVDTYATNVMGTVNVLEAVRRSPSVRAIVCISSDKCYENREWLWGYRENDPLGGRDPYSSSKGCAELVISAYRHSFFPAEEYQRHRVAIASTRAGNMMGGGDWAKDRLIPDAMAALMDNRPVSIRFPNAIRPWQHVLDPLHGYLVLAERLWSHGPEYAQAWNFGPRSEDARTVAWIVERLSDLWGESAGYEIDPGQHPYESHYLKLDCSKAEGLLRWSPKLRLSTALEWVVEWYQGYQRQEDVRCITEAQIARYEGIEVA
jgi:CDP-glucose 4,6-dehydratase